MTDDSGIVTALPCELFTETVDNSVGSCTCRQDGPLIMGICAMGIVPATFLVCTEAGSLCKNRADERQVTGVGTRAGPMNGAFFHRNGG